MTSSPLAPFGEEEAINMGVPHQPATIVVAAPSSGSGKTTVTCGLIAALTKRNLRVRPFKCGPDFLDGMQHETAARVGGGGQSLTTTRTTDDNETSSKIYTATTTTTTRRRTVNLDGWLMGSPTKVLESFQRHSVDADVCIIEGVMGLHDGKDGKSDDGSTAQIAKILGGVPVVLVIDASKSVRSVAANALGQALLDPNLRLSGVIANMVAGKAHTHWIKEAIDAQGGSVVHRLVDVGTGLPTMFLGGLPKDTSASIPERYLGLTMPHEATKDDLESRFERLATLIEENLDVDAILELGRTYKRPNPPTHPTTTITNQPRRSLIHPPPPPLSPPPPTPSKCRIGLADDAAFCFYYDDNLQLLRKAGAELVPFSPIASEKLPHGLDGIYLGGGYPELYADALELNKSLRLDIQSFAKEGGVVYAECGGLMYLAESLILSEDDPKPRFMCGVLPGLVARMTKQCTMYYAEVAFTAENPIFFASQDDDDNQSIQDSAKAMGRIQCRGQEFHYSKVEVFEKEGHSETDTGTFRNDYCKLKRAPILLTKQHPGAKPEPGGYAIYNTFASYLHLHFASGVETSRSSSVTGPTGSLADLFVQSALEHSPRSKAYAVSFASGATEIIFALEAESKLAGVTSLCDYPTQALLSPRQVVCRSRIDAASMTSEEVALAIQELKLEQQDSDGQGPPGNWIVDTDVLGKISPRVAFVQSTCDICDAASDDVLYALKEVGLLQTGSQTGHGCKIVPVAPTTLEGLFSAINDVSLALNCQQSGVKLSRKLRGRLERVSLELARVGNSRRLRVLSLEGLAPLCTGGHWLPDVKVAAGCEDALGDVGGCPARILTWDDIANADPDVLIVSPCSANCARTMSELHMVASVPQFWKLRCVQRGDAYILDHAKFSRPGPRLVEGIEMLATLLYGILPPNSEDPNKIWRGEAYKYESKTGLQQSPCKNDLAVRFKPCFLDPMLSQKDSCETLGMSESGGLRRCQVTPCAIPGKSLPLARSAHGLVSYIRGQKGTPSLLLFGGEGADSSRLRDAWSLDAPSNGWASAYASFPDDKNLKESMLCVQPKWEYLNCGVVYGENVPTSRSNHACAVYGNYLLVVGGWAADNTTPVSNCELLHLETLCWTHCSTRNNNEPPPRGNPTLVYIDGLNVALMFGGWNRSKRLNDLWCLDLHSWVWKQETTHEDDSRLAADTDWPDRRTDHSAVVWKRAAVDSRVMLVFGGSVENPLRPTQSGASSELWALELPSEKKWTWSKIAINGPSPPPRTSHAAAIVGEGLDAKMVVCGGTNCNLGTGKAGLVRDAWILSLDKMIWSKLDWSVERCRHSLVAIEPFLMLWGGFDGESPIEEGESLYITKIGGEAVEPRSTDTNNVERSIQERWDTERPVTVDDLPTNQLEKAKRSRLPGALHKALHRYAVANGRDTYIDPSSGYSVFSEVYLKRRQCCGNGCRHCPHGHINVPPKKNGESLDW